MKKILMIVSMVLCFLFSALCFADAPAPVAATGVAVLTSFASFVSSIPLSAVSLFGAFVVELIAKLLPTANPQGWLIWVGSILQKGAVILSQLASVVTQLDGVVAAVIPSNTTAAVASVATAVVKSS